jgi:hypothetical protein
MGWLLVPFQKEFVLLYPWSVRNDHSERCHWTSKRYLIFPSPFCCLSPPARERPHTTTICCHNFATDNNDQYANPAWGITITLPVDSFGKTIQINSLNYFYDRYHCRRTIILHTVQEYFWRADKVRCNTCDQARPLSQV